MRKTLLVAVLAVLAIPAFANNDGTPRSATATTTTPASPAFAIASDGTPSSSSANRR